MAENVKELGWDDGITADAGAKEFTIPPVGEYNFVVTNLEKTTSKSGHRMAKVTLALDVNGQAYPRFDYLTLIDTQLWKLATFFESLGLKQKGVDLPRMPWDKVLGAQGRCKIKHEEYNGNTSVKIERYIAKQDTLAGAAPTAPEVHDESMPFEL